jgi:hypothetical protein
MPTSHSNQLNEIVQIAELLSPKNALDVGVGNGKYGFLLREYLGSNRNIAKKDFIIDGIEGYEEYITAIHREIYNNIYLFDLNGKIELPNKEYDLCLLIDIIEHFERDKGIELIKHFSSISKFLLIATPWNIGDPSLKHDNPLEDHKYQWTKNDFRQIRHHCFVYNPESLIVVIGQDAATLSRISKKMHHKFYKSIFEYIRILLNIKQHG